MKKKLSILLILVVAVFVLATVGYAAWYITREDKTATVSNVEAYEVDSEDFEVTLCSSTGGAVVDGTDNKITFGSPDGSSSSTGWLQYENTSDSMAQEKLYVYIKLSAAYTGTFTISFDDNKGASTLYKVSYSSESTGITISGSNITTTTSTDKIIKVELDWAMEENPFTYFNGSGRTSGGTMNTSELAAANDILVNTTLVAGTNDTWKDYAVAYLEEVESLLGTATFTITVADNNH